jgi:hypothetical protein
MTVSRETVERLIQLSESQPHYGEWREFCQREGLGYQTLRYWREKLMLRRRKRNSVNAAMQT